jgi:hypothetical protein
MLLCFAAKMSAEGQLTNLKLSVKVNGGEAFVQSFPASGISPLDLTDEQVSSIVIDAAEVSATGTVSDVEVVGAVYKQSSSPEEWREIPLVNQGDGTWKLSGIGGEIVDPGRVGQTLVFEFYAKAKSGSNTVYYNNGGENYKVIYIPSGVSDGITSFELFVKVNGSHEDLKVEFPASGYPVMDMSDQPVSSIIINVVKVGTNKEMRGVKVKGTVYKLGSSPEEWRDIPLIDQGDGKWRLDGIDADLIDPSMNTDPRVFEFYVKAEGASDGHAYYYNNGGENYKVIYVKDGGASSAISFPSTGAAMLTLNVNDKSRTQYTYNGNGSRNPSVQPGELGSLVIESFSFEMIRGNSDVNVTSGSLQYRVYPSEKADGVWNGIDGNLTNWKDDNENLRTTARKDNVNLNVAQGLPVGHYTLEIKYQCIANGDFYFLPDQAGSNLYNFSISTTGVVELQAAGGKNKKVQRFNLSGQPVGENYRGIVIEDGKKVDRR